MKHVILLFPLLAFSTTLRAEAPQVVAAVNEKKGTVAIHIGKDEFTTLHYKAFAKPILHPIIGPAGVNLVRNWPVTAAAPGEEQDHPHHKGLWFTHGSVNGVDFWAEGEKMGEIIVSGTPQTGNVDALAAFVSTSENWQAPDGKKVCTSATRIVFGLDKGDRYIDYTTTIKASEGDVTFGDTKEGTMGMRSNPALNLKGKVAAGHALNSEGQKDADIWGKPARWVDYSGPVDGKMTGIACFDHPSNLRHPTTWHARDYGLIAANPFGLHDFDKKAAKGAGDHTIKKGESLTFKYRWLFHTGDTTAAKIEDRWKLWAGK